MERGEAGEVRRFDRGAVCQQEPDGVHPIVYGRPVQGAATVLRGTAVEPLDLCAVFERGGEGGRVAGDRGVPQARLGGLGVGKRCYFKGEGQRTLSEGHSRLAKPNRAWFGLWQ